MKLASQRGALVIIKQTGNEAEHSKRRALVIIKQTKNVADYSKRELW